MPGTRPGMTERNSQIHHETCRVLKAFLHTHEEGHGFLTVDDAVIVAQSEVHHRAHHNLPADHS